MVLECIRSMKPSYSCSATKFGVVVRGGGGGGFQVRGHTIFVIFDLLFLTF